MATAFAIEDTPVTMKPAAPHLHAAGQPMPCATGARRTVEHRGSSPVAANRAATGAMGKFRQLLTLPHF
jgi:hypothetical protein